MTELENMDIVHFNLFSPVRHGLFSVQSVFGNHSMKIFLFSSVGGKMSQNSKERGRARSMTSSKIGSNEMLQVQQTLGVQKRRHSFMLG